MTIAVTSGDPSGIGPEIVQKSWIYLKNNPSNEFFWIGDPLHLPDKSIPWQPIVHPNEVSENFSSALPVLVHKFAHPLKIGCHQPENANDIIEVIKKAVRLVKENKATALCTSPINKDVLNSGTQFPFLGHTEFLAYLDNIEHPVMMLASSKLKVVPATIHIPIKEVSNHLSIEGLTKTIKITNEAMKDKFGLAQPVIAVDRRRQQAGHRLMVMHQPGHRLAGQIGQGAVRGNHIAPLCIDKAEIHMQPRSAAFGDRLWHKCQDIAFLERQLAGHEPE